MGQKIPDGHQTLLSELGRLLGKPQSAVSWRNVP
jgi:hypothetical protein